MERFHIKNYRPRRRYTKKAITYSSEGKQYPIIEKLLSKYSALVLGEGEQAGLHIQCPADRVTTRSLQNAL